MIDGEAFGQAVSDFIAMFDEDEKNHFIPDTTEIDRLEALINERHPDWDCTRRPSNGGHQICFLNRGGHIKASAVIHYFSYGHGQGLLEFWAGGDSDAKGWLTAEEALKEFEKALS